MPNMASGAKKKKLGGPVDKRAEAQRAAAAEARSQGPIDPADMQAVLAAKKAAKQAGGAKEKEQKKTAKEKLKEYQAAEGERRRKEKAERDKIAAKAAERAKEADLAAARRRLKSERTVEMLQPTDDPQAVAQCVARTLGIQGASLKPKEVLALTVEKMPEVALADGLPKEQLLQLAAALVERRAVKRAAESEKLAAEKGAAASAQQAAAEEAARAKAERAEELVAQAAVAKARAVEMKALREQDPNRCEPEPEQARDEEPRQTKEQAKAAKRVEAMAAAVVREAALLEEEMAAARQASARARTSGREIGRLGPIETGDFSLPNPGGGPDLLENASLTLVPGRRYGLIGRNGKGKSTLLKYLSARRVGSGALPQTLSLHYVSQTSADDMGEEKEVAEEEKYKFLAVSGKDKYWKEMTDEEQKAGLLLGWTSESWDGGSAEPMEGLFWTVMTVVQRTAAETLGHSAATWDLEMSPEQLAALEAAAEPARAEAATRRAGPSAAEVVLRADIERSLLLEQVAALEAEEENDPTAEDLAQLEHAHERLREIGAGSAFGRATQLLKNLGFSDELLRRSVRDLSGGWRVRVALAAALFAAPDVLLLDEPTNHLSIEAVLWLQHELTTNPIWESKIVVAVSHDRTFLDAVCSDSLHISGSARRLTQERGNYSAWAKRRVAKKKAFDAKSNKREIEMDHMKEFIGRGGSYQNASIQRKQKEDQLRALEQEAAADADEQAALQEDEELALTIHAGGKLDRPPIKLSDVSFAYPGMAAPLFEHVELCIDCGSRLVLLGENGRGKTTLVKLMLGELQPTTGAVAREQGARVALLNQHHADQLNLDESPLDFLAGQYREQHKGAAVSRVLLESMRGHLSSCGIESALQLVPGRALSGGQRSRLAMAAVSFLRPHVLVLDEPTNNLDVEAVEALADTVAGFEGAVVIVSHDQHFVSRVANEVWVVGEQDGDGAARSVRKLPSFETYIEEAHARATGVIPDSSGGASAAAAASGTGGSF